MSPVDTIEGSEPAEILGRPPGRLRRLRVGEFTWVWFALALLFLASAVFAPAAVDVSSLKLMLPYASILAIAAVGQTLVIRQRAIDLSVPGILGLSAVVVCGLGSNDGLPLVWCLLITCAAMALIGLCSGVLVTRLGITPLVATLAMNALLIGAIQSYSGDVPQPAPSSLSRFALGHFLGVPNTAIVALVIVVVAALMTNKTLAGRRFAAAGENSATSWVAGIDINRYQVATFMLAALCYGIAGILLAGYVQTAEPQAGNSYLLPVIAAVVVGGTPFTGGRGSVVATAAGALFLSQLDQVVLTLGAPTSVQLLIQSAAIAVATILRHFRIAHVRRLWSRVRQTGLAAPAADG